MKKNKKRFTKKERFFIAVSIIAFAGIYVSDVLFNSKISNIKMNISGLESKIESEEKKNESLTMQVNELTSYDNVSYTIKDMGLAYNNENIVIIK